MQVNDALAARAHAIVGELNPELGTGGLRAIDEVAAKKPTPRCALSLAVKDGRAYFDPPQEISGGKVMTRLARAENHAQRRLVWPSRGDVHGAADELRISRAEEPVIAPAVAVPRHVALRARDVGER